MAKIIFSTFIYSKLLSFLTVLKIMISFKILIISLMLVYFNPVSAQSINIDSVLVNGSVTKYSRYSDFLKSGIKIDSVRSSKPMSLYDPDSIIFVGSSVFWYDSKRGTCDARRIWFDKITYVQFGKYLVNSLTSSSDLRKMFPMNCNVTKPINLVRFKGTSLETCSVDVKDSKGQLWDMRILFFLKDDKLIGLDFWEPM